MKMANYLIPHLQICVFVTGFLLLLPVIVHAQNDTGSGMIGISVEVVPAATETITLRNFDFTGLDRSSGLIDIDPATSERAGKMVLTGTPNASFQLTYLPERLLENHEGNGTLLFQYIIAGNEVDDQGTSELIADETRELQFNDNGEYYIWIGGFVNFEFASPGSYVGDFTLEIDYI